MIDNTVNDKISPLESSNRVEVFEKLVEQEAYKTLDAMRPVIRAYDFIVTVGLSRNRPVSDALTPGYKSTLDIFIYDWSRVLWCDSLIVIIDGMPWIELSQATDFVRSAVNEGMRLKDEQQRKLLRIARGESKEGNEEEKHDE